MANITYTALRNVSSAHVANTEYGQDFTASRLQRSVKTNSKTSKSLDNSSETLRYASEVTWDIAVNEVEHADMPIWREILESIDGGEQFTFDAYGTSAAVDSVANCKMTSKGYTESRIGTTMYYNLRFKLREV